MNEQYLWELWNKCKHPHPKYGGGDMVWPIEFAELIVRECACIADDMKSLDVAAAIKDHFGVEE
jgi:hypothetical protein